MADRQKSEIRLLRWITGLLVCAVAVLFVNTLHPFLYPRVLNAERINIRERDGTLKAVLANSAVYSSEGERAKQGGVPFSGLMFYNQEGQEQGGLIYSGKGIPGGQDQNAALTFDQYNQDQDVYLHHEEHRDVQGSEIEDGLSINSRPDWRQIKTEFGIYAQMQKLAPEQRDALKLKALQEGKIATRRIFFGERRGEKSSVPYDDAGVFIRNRWGRDAIRLYVDYNNQPHLEVLDPLGHAVQYDLIANSSKTLPQASR